MTQHEAILERLDEIGSVLDAIYTRLARIDRRIGAVEAREKQAMVNLDKLVQETEEQSTVVESVVTLVQGLRDELVAAAGDQTKIDEIVSKLDAHSQRLAQAVSQSDDVEEPTPVDPAPADGGDTPADPAPGGDTPAAGRGKKG